MTNEKEYQNTAYGCGLSVLSGIIAIALMALFSIVSCTTVEDAKPSICDTITSDHYAPQRVHLVIDSKEPELTFTWSLNGNITHEITVDYPYYHELWLVLCSGYVLTINGQCTFEGR